jgi:GH15 family glucan-1,4-alpha-glucosidase
MADKIEDYAIIGDTSTVGLVARSGSIDWWCVPRIDSPAAFAALLGTNDNGRWLMAPDGDVTSVSRAYEPETLILETVFDTPAGCVAVVDLMPPGHDTPTIHRIVEGRRGTVKMQMELIVRFSYGSVTPWVRPTGDGLLIVAGGDGLRLHSSVPLSGTDHTTTASFEIGENDRRTFSLTWFPSAEGAPLPLDSLAVRHYAQQWWRNWAGRCSYAGEYRDDVIRSLITLKALTYDATGAVCAAATTSLPESLGGVRNWDYRYSWLRDATFTLQALLLSGYTSEAAAWVHWLRRAVAGSPGEFQIMYGVRGERRLTEFELDYLPGYEGSKPVRVGNKASTQFQLDVFGEVMDSALTTARSSLPLEAGWDPDLLLALLEHLETAWKLPDDGIWEVRGPRRHFTHSKVMAWVAFDRAIRLAEHHGTLPPDRVDGWTKVRDRIQAEVCAKGFDTELNSFTQYYGSKLLDASLLMLAPVGFLPADDARIAGTVAAIQKGLVEDGFVQRYQTDGNGVDGLPGTEGAFLMTTFWLADNLALMGRIDEAREIFDRLRALRNDVGLLSEEYDPSAGRMLGNFPQAFSHVALIDTAANLSFADRGPSAARSSRLPLPAAGMTSRTEKGDVDAGSTRAP